MRGARVSAVAAAVALCLASTAAAATEVEFKGGINVSRFQGESAFDDADARIGLAAGAALRWPLGGPWAFQPEIQFAQKGVALEDVPGVTEDAFYEVDYLELPLLLRLGVPGGGGVAPAVFAGPAVAVELAEQIRVKSGLLRGTASRSDLDDVDVAIVAGFGLDFGDEGTRVLVDVRTHVGVLDVAKADGRDTVRTFDLRLAIGVVRALAP